MIIKHPFIYVNNTIAKSLFMFLIILLSFFYISTAQPYAYKKTKVYYLDKNFLPAKLDSKTDYYLQVVKSDDTTYSCRYYNKYGPMVKLESFLDSTLFIPNGRFAWYDSHGNIDSSAHVYRGHKASFASYDDSLKPLISVKYQDGNLFEKRDYVQNIYTDSTGNTSDLKEKEKAEDDKWFLDSIKSEAAPARFGKNGYKEWNKYIRKHLSVPDRFGNVMQKAGCRGQDSLL